MKMLKGKKGFTLIELVIVIAILGILAGLAIPRFLDATATARGSRIVADMRTVDSAIVIYNAKTGSLPTASTQLVGEANGKDVTGDTYKLLASWPVPPTGSAIITNDAGNAIKLTSTAARTYDYDATNGRCTLGGSNVSQILALTADKAI